MQNLSGGNDATQISKIFGKNQNSSIDASSIDYTSSRFHNALAGRAETTMVISEAVRAHNEQKAFEKAQEEELKKKQDKARKE